MAPKTLKLRVSAPLLAFLFALGGSMSSALAQAPSPTLNTPLRSTNGQVQLSVNGLTNYYYALEKSSNFINWITVQTNSTAKDGGIATFQLSPTNAQTFFRARLVGKRYYPLFESALAVKESIDLNGNNLGSDSYDSSNPIYSSYVTNANFGTNLVYDTTKRLDHGDVAAIFGITNVASLGNVNIWGKLHTGVGSVATTADIGPNSNVGDAIWQASGIGFQPGAWLYDMTMPFPNVVPPPSGGLPPASGLYKGIVFNYLLAASGGRYEINAGALSGKMCVTGSNVTLWAKGGLNFSGSTGGIFIAPGASIVIYVGNSSGTNSVTADFTGNGGINANGYAKNCQIYGLPNCTTIQMSANSSFVGTIYAPNALMSNSGGGNNVLDSMGAIIVKSAKLNSHWNFHFDEALLQTGPTY